MELRLIDEIMTRLLNENLLGEIKYICVNAVTKKELLDDFSEEFSAEYEELGRAANRQDLEEHLRLKIMIDEHIKDHGYILLSKQ